MFLRWLLQTIAVFLLLSAGTIHADEVAEAREKALASLGKPIEKLKVRELQALLSERGVECVACSEKADLVERVRETIHLPLAEKVGEAASEASKRPGGDARSIEELLASMKGMPGFENVKVFNRDDLDGIAQGDWGKPDL